MSDNRDSSAATWTDTERQIVLQNLTKTPTELLTDHPELSRFSRQQISNQKASLVRGGYVTKDGIILRGIIVLPQPPSVSSTTNIPTTPSTRQEGTTERIPTPVVPRRFSPYTSNDRGRSRGRGRGRGRGHNANVLPTQRNNLEEEMDEEEQMEHLLRMPNSRTGVPNIPSRTPPRNGAPVDASVAAFNRQVAGLRANLAEIRAEEQQNRMRDHERRNLLFDRHVVSIQTMNAVQMQRSQSLFQSAHVMGELVGLIARNFLERNGVQLPRGTSTNLLELLYGRDDSSSDESFEPDSDDEFSNSEEDVNEEGIDDGDMEEE